MKNNKKISARIFWVLVLSIPIKGFTQELLNLKQYFETDLKGWTSSFRDFKLAEFKMVDTIEFSHDRQKEFINYNEFLSVYKPILTWSADSIQFIDIYSVPLNIQRKDSFYVADPNDHQGIYLCNPVNRYWAIIYSGAWGGGIDEVIWVSKTKFILAGTEHASNGPQSLPVILVGDTKSQRFERYRSPDQSCFQENGGYLSPKLMKMKIRYL